MYILLVRKSGRVVVGSGIRHCCDSLLCIFFDRGEHEKRVLLRKLGIWNGLLCLLQRGSGIDAV